MILDSGSENCDLRLTSSASLRDRRAKPDALQIILTQSCSTDMIMCGKQLIICGQVQPIVQNTSEALLSRAPEGLGPHLGPQASTEVMRASNAIFRG